MIFCGVHLFINNKVFSPMANRKLLIWKQKHHCEMSLKSRTVQRVFIDGNSFISLMTFPMGRKITTDRESLLACWILFIVQNKDHSRSFHDIWLSALSWAARLYLFWFLKLSQTNLENNSNLYDQTVHTNTLPYLNIFVKWMLPTVLKFLMAVDKRERFENSLNMLTFSQSWKLLWQ